MLFSLALVFLCGLALGKVFEKLKLPSFLGMLITGLLLGPYTLNLLDPVILNISADLRQIALIVILARAGLNLDIKDLIKVGRPALLLCFVPACFEIIVVLIFAPLFFEISVLDAAIIGTAIAAVSPAVVIPRMLTLMERGYGKNKSIPQMIMAGSSVDDVFVIVLFVAFTGLAQKGTLTPLNFLSIPTSIIFGLLGGILAGLALSLLFEKVHMRDTGKVVIILSVSFLLVTLEQHLKGIIGFSGLLAVLALSAFLQQRKYAVSKRLSRKFSKLWVTAEVLLFVLVGATVNVSYALEAGLFVFLLIIIALLFRIIGVFASLIKTNLNRKERLFTAFAYTPKATVQAAIGGIPLVMGLACGNLVLTAAVLSIIITAPLGATLIDVSYKKLLTKDSESNE